MTASEVAALLPCRWCGAPPTAPLGEFCDGDDLHEFPVTAPFSIDLDGTTAGSPSRRSVVPSTPADGSAP